MFVDELLWDYRGLSGLALTMVVAGLPQCSYHACHCEASKKPWQSEGCWFRIALPAPFEILPFLAKISNPVDKSAKSGYSIP